MFHFNNNSNEFYVLIVNFVIFQTFVLSIVFVGGFVNFRENTYLVFEVGTLLCTGS